MGLFDKIFGGGKTSSRSTNESFQRSFVDPAQAPYLQGLYGAGTAAALGALPQLYGAGLQQGQQGQSYALAGLGGQLGLAGNLQQQVGGGLNQAVLGLLRQAQSTPDFAPLQAQLRRDPYAAARQQLGALSQDLGSFFQRDILPGLQSQAVGFGQAGGSRQGVAQGIAAGDLARALSSAGASLYGNAVSQQQNVAAQLAQARLGAFGQQLGAYSAAGGLGLGGLGQAGSLYGQLPGQAGVPLGLQQQSALSPFLALQQLAQLIGPPNNLVQGQSSSTSTSSGRESKGILPSITLGF